MNNQSQIQTIEIMSDKIINLERETVEMQKLITSQQEKIEYLHNELRELDANSAVSDVVNKLNAARKDSVELNELKRA